METLGGLIDQLITVDMKLWHAQDRLYKYAQMDQDAFSAEPASEVHDLLKKVADLNLQRNKLMTAIDECYARGIATGKVEVDSRAKFT